MTREVHAIIILLIIGAVTLATRILPVLIFGRNENIPSYILYLGKTVPYTAMGLLIVYCLKDIIGDTNLSLMNASGVPDSPHSTAPYHR